MNYHRIKHSDMNNGEGIRTVLWVSGCEHKCSGCFNAKTWDKNSGVLFDETSLADLTRDLNEEWCDGITLSGGDPFYPDNISEIKRICLYIKNNYPNKNIWIYTGYTLEELKNKNNNNINTILNTINVLIDGKYVKELSCKDTHWIGSSNQKIVHL